MARSAWDKIRVTVLGNLHDLLDRGANSIPAYEQTIRDLDNKIHEVRRAGDSAAGQVTVYSNQVTAKNADIAKKQGSILDLLGDDDPSNDHFAVDLQVEIEDLTSEVTGIEALKVDAEKLQAELTDAANKLDARLRVMQAGLNKLKLQDAAAKAKSGASDAIEMAGEALDAANNGGFDSIKGAIEQRSAEADARFDRVVGGLQAGQSPEEAAKLARANAAIAALRAKMTAKATSQDSAS
jgi:phage shock protein A